MRIKDRRWKVVALLAVGISIGVAMSATPAVSHVSGWVHNWNRHIKPRTDARYYRKALADARYYNVGETAANATNAANADKLDGVDSSQLQFRTAQSGQTLSGQLAARYVANSAFTLAESTYPVPLPLATATPTLEYVPGAATATCPGIGQASAGLLCVYGYNTSNIGSVSFGGSVSGNSKIYGFSLDVFPTDGTAAGFLLANWAYRVP